MAAAFLSSSSILSPFVSKNRQKNIKGKRKPKRHSRQRKKKKIENIIKTKTTQTCLTHDYSLSVSSPPQQKYMRSKGKRRPTGHGGGRDFAILRNDEKESEKWRSLRKSFKWETHCSLVFLITLQSKRSTAITNDDEFCTN